MILDDSVTDPDPDISKTAASPVRAQDVAHELSVAIHEQRLAPGTKLSEDEVGEIYGVSRTVVRSALQQLSHELLVVIERNRGAFVAQPSIREAREVFEARALLEPRTAHSAAHRTTPASIALLRSHLEAEHAAMHDGDAGRAVRLSAQFHNEIARIADQDTIAQFIATLVARSALIIAVFKKRDRALCDSQAHHALVNALEAHDGPLAEELMAGHLVDLLSALDLTPKPDRQFSLRDALTPH